VIVVQVANAFIQLAQPCQAASPFYGVADVSGDT